jgi:hypothetical protein
MAIFFKRNKFIITPAGFAHELPADRVMARLPCSTFLREVVPGPALRHLRQIEIALPSFDAEYTQLEDFAPRDWQSTIEYLASSGLNLPQLTITVHLPQNCMFNARRPKQERLALFTVYTRIIKPLSQLPGLGRFFARLTQPYPWTLGPRRYRTVTPPPWVPVRTADLERFLEKMVMGDAYDATRLRKVDQVESQWLHQVRAWDDGV